jgi:hypothetical protein
MNAEGRRDLAVAVLLTEATALLIALVMPVTPSRTGSTWSLAELVWPEPSYLQEVAVYFLATNALILLIGGAAWVWYRLRGPAS